MEDYTKQLEDDNQKLREKLEREQVEADKYKDYFDLIKTGEVIRYSPYGDGDFDIFGRTQKERSQSIQIALKFSDLDKYPLLHEKVEEYARQCHRLHAVKEENEIKWEARKRILIISLIAIGSGLALWGIGYAVWWAYFVTL